MEYRLCPHVGAGMVCYRLGEDALVVTREKLGRVETIPFADLTRVNLRQELPGAWTVQLSRSKGGKITVPSRHFEGPGRFEARNKDYLAFVQTLHARVAAANSGTRFIAGSSGLFLFGWACIGLALVSVVGILASVAQGIWPRGRVLSIPILLGGIGYGFQRQGRASSYDPAHPPDRLLPPPG